MQFFKRATSSCCKQCEQCDKFKGTVPNGSYKNQHTEQNKNAKSTRTTHTLKTHYFLCFQINQMEKWGANTPYPRDR